MRRTIRSTLLVASLLAAVVAAQAVPAAATHGDDTLVSVGSPSTSQEAATSPPGRSRR